MAPTRIDVILQGLGWLGRIHDDAGIAREVLFDFLESATSFANGQRARLGMHFAPGYQTQEAGKSLRGETGGGR